MEHSMEADVYKAIQEFEDNAYHNSLHPVISEFAKAVALSSMQKEIRFQDQIAELRAQLTIYRGFNGCRLQELIDADLDGRVIVLPCRVGDTVWVITNVFNGAKTVKMIGSRTIDEIKHNKLNKNTMISKQPYELHFYPSEIGKTVFLTRGEAEVALEGGGADG